MPTVPVPEDLEVDLLAELARSSEGEAGVERTASGPDGPPRIQRSSVLLNEPRDKVPGSYASGLGKASAEEDDELPGVLDPKKRLRLTGGELPRVLDPGKGPCSVPDVEIDVAAFDDIEADELDALLESAPPSEPLGAEPEAAVFEAPRAPPASARRVEPGPSVIVTDALSCAECENASPASVRREATTDPRLQKTLPPRRRRSRGRRWLTLGSLVVGACAAGLLFPHLSAEGFNSLRTHLGKALAQGTKSVPAPLGGTLERSDRAVAESPSPPQVKQQVVSQGSPDSQPQVPPTEPAVTGIPWLDGAQAKQTVCVPPSRATDQIDGPSAVLAEQTRAHARALLRQGDTLAALDRLCEAAALNPESAKLAAENGRVALMARDAEGSARWAERTLELAPDDRHARELLGDALAWQGQVVAAKRAWLMAHHITRPNDKVIGHLYRGAMQQAAQARARRNYVFAERMLRRALMFDPTSVVAMTQIAEGLIEQGHPVAARRWAEYALGVEPRNATARAFLGDTFAAVGDEQTAVQHYQQALELEPKNALIRQRLAQRER